MAAIPQRYTTIRELRYHGYRVTVDAKRSEFDRRSIEGFHELPTKGKFGIVTVGTAHTHRRWCKNGAGSDVFRMILSGDTLDTYYACGSECAPEKLLCPSVCVEVIDIVSTQWCPEGIIRYVLRQRTVVVRHNTCTKLRRVFDVHSKFGK